MQYAMIVQYDIARSKYHIYIEGTQQHYVAHNMLLSFQYVGRTGTHTSCCGKHDVLFPVSDDQVQTQAARKVAATGTHKKQKKSQQNVTACIFRL